MRKFAILFCCVFLFAKAKADDVTATVIPTVIGFNNGSITLTLSAGIAPYTFSWTGPDAFVSTEQNISSLAAGEYCVTVTDAVCGVATICVTVEATTANSISQPENQILSLQVSPNPFSTTIQLAINSSISGTYIAELQDISGKTILTMHLQLTPGNNNINFDQLPQLPSGTYQIVLHSPNGSTTTKPLIKL